MCIRDSHSLLLIMLEGRTASSAPAAAFIPLGKLIPCDPGKSQVAGSGAAEKLDIFQGEAGGRRNAEVLEQIKGLTVNCEEVEMCIRDRVRAALIIRGEDAPRASIMAIK